MGWTQPASAAPPREYELSDISGRPMWFEPSVLGVARTAPVWMTPAERLLLFTLVYALRPNRYLEIGTFKGGSALLVAGAMDALGTKGRLVCLDPEPQMAPGDWATIAHRATMLRGYSPDALPEAERLAGGRFDFVLIDGDHSAAGVLRDATGVLTVVAPGAHLVFHDCFNPEVARGIDEFARVHAGRLRDVGPLTREISCEQAPDGSRVVWGGLRVMMVD